MQWTPSLSHYLAHLVFEEWKKLNQVEWKVSEEKVASAVHQVLLEDLQKEKDLEKEVHQMLDELEKIHPGEFERYKMYPLLKKKLAKQKGVIL